MCVGKTADVIWECSEQWTFKGRQRHFRRNHSLIRPKAGEDFLS
jgi:hypothetical protein